MAESDSPMQVQRVVAEVLRQHLEHNLDERDKAALQKASTQLLSHASTGLWLGSAAGAALAFRGKWQSAARAARAGLANAQGAEAKAAASTFYPTKASTEIGKAAAAGAGAGATGPVMSEARQKGANVRFMLKGLGLGLLGGFVGTQIGVVTGTFAGRNTIKTEGNEERISAAIRKVSVELAQRTGSSSQLGQVYGSGIPRQSNGEVIEDSNSVPGESFYGRQTVDDLSRDDGSSRGAAPREEKASRWEELRKERAAPPSSWDEIRQTNARESLSNYASKRGLPAEKGLRLEGELPSGSNSTMDGMPRRGRMNDDDPGEGRKDRDTEKIEFEKMMERERKGSDRY